MEQTESSTPAFSIIPHENEHGLGVSLPTWESAVKYASRRPDVLNYISTEHSKFFIHPITDALGIWITTRYEELQDASPASTLSQVQAITRKVESAGPSEVFRRALLFPSAFGADRCKTYLKGIIDKSRKCQISVLITGFPTLKMRTPLDQKEIDWGNIELHVVLYPSDLAEHAKAFWNNTGFGISSRYAELCFNNFSETSKRNWLASSKSSIVPPFAEQLPDSPVGLPNPCPLKQYSKTREILIDRLVDLYSSPQSVSAEEVYLYPSGRAAWTMVADVIKHLNPAGQPSEFVCYGFHCVSYFRTLSKILQIPTVLLGNCSLFELDHLSSDLESGRKIAAVFVDVPGDPLLKTPDLHRLHTLALRYNFIIVCDDTVATPINVKILHLSDIVVSSLSKMFSGACNVKGGSVVLNSKGRHFNRLKNGLSTTYIDTCFPLDMIILEENSRDFFSRVQQSNYNAEAVTRVLSEHGTVRHVFYPKGSLTEFRYNKCKSLEGGYGYLLSVLFKESAQAIAFYDALGVAKGPTFGTSYTIACPYTVLTHYQEMSWAAGFGVQEFLIRISIGIEEPSILKRKVEAALLAAKEVSV